jgi:hypothetical protein
VLDVWPAPPSSDDPDSADVAEVAEVPHAGRQNLFPRPPRLRPRLDVVEVTLRGALVALDLTVAVERLGMALATDPAKALADARDDIAARLADGLATLTTVDQPGLLGLVAGPTEDYRVEDLHYTAELVDEGLRVVVPDRAVDLSDAEQPWIRSILVTEATQ